MTTPRDLTAEFWEDVSRLLPPSPVILDLGSHHLEEAQALIPLLSGRSQWHGFEANPQCCSLMRSTVLHRLAELADVTLNEVAISQGTGSATLFRSEKTDGQPWTASSSIRPPKNALPCYPWMTFDNGIPVATISLDEYCQSKKIAGIDFLKMDIQGAEIDAVRGGLQTFSRTSYVLTEVCECEEYEGQVGLSALVAEMPGTWVVVERLLNDVLLKNITTSVW
jgi:FkbM family methyltransferase